MGEQLVTKERFRRLLDELKLTHRIDDDGDFAVQLSADSDCQYEVYVFYRVLENKIQVIGLSKLNIPEVRLHEALMFCNDWNTAKMLQCNVNLETKKLQTTYSLFTDVALSDEYIKENVIKLGSAMTWQFFVAAAKQFSP